MIHLTDAVDKVHETDVLVVGSGGAGLRAAVESAKHGVRTTIVSKGAVRRSGVTMMAGCDLWIDGVSACELGFDGDRTYTKEDLFNEIVITGFYLNNQKLVEVYARDAGDRIKELVEWGMKIHHYDPPSMLWATGEEIIDVLLHRLREQEVEALNDIMITDVLTSKGKVVGALGINVFSGDIVGFATKAVVLATGGWGQVYSFTSATEDLTGDGQAIAYRAGADLVDMEMVTFCPSVQIWPPGPARGSMFVYRLAWLGSYLLNKYGERFMCNYPEEIADISLRTEWHKLIWSVAQAIEVDEARGSPHGGIYKSVKHLPWNVVNESLDWRAKGWKFKGADMSDIAEILKSGNAIEVGPAAHYFEGGVKIDETCQTTVPGLFAAGECAGGLFGSNRVAAATTEVIVEGAVAGKSASKYATECPNNAEVDVEQVKRTKERLLEPHRRESGIDPIELRKRVRRIADESIHVIRDSERLGKAVRELEEIRRKDLPRIQVLEKSRRYNMQWVLAIELGNMIQLLELSARSALMRTESRGVHYRLDFPVMNNDDWLKEVVTRSVDGEPCLNCRKVTVTKMIPPSGRMPYFDAILDAVRKIKVYRKSRLV